MGKATIGGRHKQKKKNKPKYITRSKALRELQVPIEIFRHLCILKGIYPKEPKRGKSGKLSYLYRDIKLLKKDPILQKYHEECAWLKKLRKATDKEDLAKQESMIKWSKPIYDYAPLVRERYSSFVEALRDLDDCLSLMFMCRSFPSSFTIDEKLLQKVTELCEDFCSFLVKTKSLEKVFVTTKGVYLRAVVDRVNITWIAPLNFGFSSFQEEKDDVKVNKKLEVFRSFLFYYTTLMKFVNFHLYTYKLENSIDYPLKINKEKTFPRSFFFKLDLEKKEKKEKTETKKVKKLNEQQLEELMDAEKEKGEEKIDDVKKETVNEEGLLELLDMPFEPKVNWNLKSVFEGLTFFISRECPQPLLEILIVTYDGKVSQYLDSSVNIIIVERKNVPDNYKEYEMVHPQWILDSFNFKMQLPREKYRPNQKIPPHLSPFVDYSKEQYIPDYAIEIQSLIEEKIKMGGGNVPSLGINIHEEEDDIEEFDEFKEEAKLIEEMELERSGVNYEDYVKEAEKRKKEEMEKQLLKKGMSKKKLENEKRILSEANFKKIVLSSRKKYSVEQMIKRKRISSDKVRKLTKKKMKHKIEEMKREKENPSKAIIKEKKEKKEKETKRREPVEVKVSEEKKEDVDQWGDAGMGGIVFGIDGNVEVGEKRKREEKSNDEVDKKKQKTA